MSNVEDAIQVQSTGLVVAEDLDYDTWAEYMKQWLQRRNEALDYVDRVSLWIIGDLYVYGEDKFGDDEAAQIADHYSADTIRKARWVARSVPREERIPDLSFGHHEVVAKKDPAERKALLEDARKNELSVYELRKKIRKEPKGRGSGKSGGGPARDPDTAGQRQDEDELTRRRTPPSDDETQGKCPFCGGKAALIQFRSE